MFMAIIEKLMGCINFMRLTPQRRDRIVALEPVWRGFRLGFDSEEKFR
jgi:hypothetical protein